MRWEVTSGEVTRRELSEVLTLEKEQAKGIPRREAFCLGGIGKAKVTTSCLCSGNGKNTGVTGLAVVGERLTE